MDATVQCPAPAAMNFRSCLALPELSPRIPLQYVIPGKQHIAAPFAMALIEYGMITDHDFQPKDSTLMELFREPDEKELVERTLTSWWQRKNKDLKIFHWDLHIQNLEAWQSDSDKPWFVISVAKSLVPQRTLARPIEELERECAGFGQTALAVLNDAFRYLPEAWIPSRVFDLAQMYYWGGCNNEEDYIAEHIGTYGDFATREEFIEACGEPFSRADFFRHAPEWMVNAERTCSRSKLERAASSPLGKNVIAACDAIHSLVTSKEFHLNPYDVGTHSSQLDCVLASLFLRWSEDDACGQVLDDAVNDMMQGESIDAIVTSQVAPTPAALKKYLTDIEQMLQMALAVERLLLLISEPATGAD